MKMLGFFLELWGGGIMLRVNDIQILIPSQYFCFVLF